MYIFNVISVTVPLVLALLLPRVLAKRHAESESLNRWILYLGCALFFISWYLPSPMIEGRDTAFTTHFVGGGLFCGLLWIYLKNALRLRMHWVFEVGLLYALVSALGVVNELAELFFSVSGLAPIPLDDTNWDLLANTLGALTAYLIYRVFITYQEKGKSTL